MADRVRRYAEGTQVPVSSSRGDITGILAKHGVENMGWTTTPQGDELFFVLDGQSYRLGITKPTTDTERERARQEKRSLHLMDFDAQVEKEWRRRWRATVLILKAKLEMAQSGDTTVQRELMPYLMTNIGKTLGELLESGGIPLLGAGESKQR